MGVACRIQSVTLVALVTPVTPAGFDQVATRCAIFYAYDLDVYQVTVAPSTQHASGGDCTVANPEAITPCGQDSYDEVRRLAMDDADLWRGLSGDRHAGKRREW